MQVTPIDAQPEKASSGSLAVLDGIGKLVIQQEVNLMEAAADALGYGCFEMPNVYNVYDGEPFNAAVEAATNPEEVNAAKAAHQLLTIRELGEFGCTKAQLCRCCCNPFHTMTLSVTNKRESDAPIFWIDRPFRCCGCAYLCCSCCLQEWTVHEGAIPALGDTYDPAKAASLIGRVAQPICGGGCCPKFDIYGIDQTSPVAFLRGPHFIGELCCSVDFRLTKPKAEGESEEEVIGNITKLGAKDGMDALKELMTDADNFEMDLTPGSVSFTAEEKAAALTGLVLLDFYFFESGGAFECDPFAAPGEPLCKLNICTEYYCGTLVGWTCKCKKSDGSG